MSQRFQVGPWQRSWRRLVGEGVRDRRRWPVYAITHSRSFAAVNDQRKQLVYHIVIQRPSTTRLVGAPVEGRLLDLKEAVRCVRLCDVDYHVVGEQQLCQGVDTIRAKRPVNLTIQ